MIKVVFSFLVIYVTNINYYFFHQTRHAVGTYILLPQEYVWWVLNVEQKSLQFLQTSVVVFHMTRMNAYFNVSHLDLDFCLE